MNNPALVRVFQGRDYLRAIATLRRRASDLGRISFDEFHDERARLDPVNRRYVGMVQEGQDYRFTLKAAAAMVCFKT